MPVSYIDFTLKKTQKLFLLTVHESRFTTHVMYFVLNKFCVLLVRCAPVAWDECQ